MKKIEAIYNHGRWIVLCPIHGTRGAMNAESEYICPVCHPAILAFMTVVKGGIMRTIPDISARKTARLRAEEKGEVYTVIYPKERKKIEKELGKLPPMRQNWQGEPIEKVTARARHEVHIIENYNKRDKSLDAEV